MRTLARALALALALGLCPSTLALDAFPQESSWGAADARVLVRLPEGGRLRVEAEPAVVVALVEPGSAPGATTATPAEFDVTPRASDASWHGLAGTVELALHRADPARAVEIFAEDEQGGAVFEWPAAAPHVVPTVGAAAALAACGVALAGLAWGRRR